MLSYIAWLILQLRILKQVFIGEVKGIENFQVVQDRGIILVSNHKSGTDPWRIGGAIPFRFGGVYWFAAYELLHLKSAYELWLSDNDKDKIKAFLYALASVILVRFSLILPVDRRRQNKKLNERSIEFAKKLLNNKQVVALFPEGSTTKHGRAHPLFVHLAIETKSVIVPIKINDSNLIFGNPIEGSSLNPKRARRIAKEIITDIYSM